MNSTHLVITSIAGDKHPVLNQFAKEAKENNIDFILVGDTKSPRDFNLDNCDYYSIERQESLSFQLVENLPTKHYARKNVGYLQAIAKGANIIIETDDDNIPYENFWEARVKKQDAQIYDNGGWTNVYKYFTEKHIWPRGFALEHILDKLPELDGLTSLNSPIQQGLADENPDVDALYRLTLPLPVTFNKRANIALANHSICPFNSQNTTWFKEAFPLLYLPSYCSFRMTDIWRSFVAQRITWSCDWVVLFHSSTVWQDRNDHNLMKDFEDEISGYFNNLNIMSELSNLKLKKGVINISENMILCYEKLITLNLVGKEELPLLKSWLKDLSSLNCI